MTSVAPIYDIRVRGHLGPRWACRLGQLTITREPYGETLISGPIVDQAALHGTLTTIRDLGLTLLSITCIDPDTDASHRKDTP